MSLTGTCRANISESEGVLNCWGFFSGNIVAGTSTALFHFALQPTSAQYLLFVFFSFSKGFSVCWSLLCQVAAGQRCPGTNALREAGNRLPTVTGAALNRWPSGGWFFRGLLYTASLSPTVVTYCLEHALPNSLLCLTSSLLMPSTITSNLNCFHSNLYLRKCSGESALGKSRFLQLQLQYFLLVMNGQ